MVQKCQIKRHKNHFDSEKEEVVSFPFFYFLQTKIYFLVLEKINATLSIFLLIFDTNNISIALRKMENNLMGSVVSLNAEIS